MGSKLGSGERIRGQCRSIRNWSNIPANRNEPRRPTLHLHRGIGSKPSPMRQNRILACDNLLPCVRNLRKYGPLSSCSKEFGWNSNFHPRLIESTLCSGLERLRKWLVQRIVSGFEDRVLPSLRSLFCRLKFRLEWRDGSMLADFFRFFFLCLSMRFHWQ